MVAIAFLAVRPAEPPAAETTLLRALRDDVDFPFVAIGAGVAYRVRHEDGAPDGREGVVVVDPFEVPESDAERFVAGWNGVRGLLAAERGYLGTRLHEAVDAAAAFRFVSVARWSSPLMVSRAQGRPEVREAARALPHLSHPAVYQVVDVA